MAYAVKGSPATHAFISAQDCYLISDDSLE